MDAGTKDREILFLNDRICQLESQLSILQRRILKRRRKPRYTLRERLFILWHIETFGIAGRKVTKHLGVSRSALYRWLHQVIFGYPLIKTGPLLGEQTKGKKVVVFFTGGFQGVGADAHMLRQRRSCRRPAPRTSGGPRDLVDQGVDPTNVNVIAIGFGSKIPIAGFAGRLENR